LRVTVAGAGMAGLVAAVRLRELGHDPRVVEKGTRVGGSMLLSSCVVWRHLDWETFRAECPGGDERLQRLIWERLDDALGWLEALGAEPVWRDTENPLTTGRRYDPRALTALLAAAAGDVELQTPLPADAEPPVLLATGGFGARLARERGLLLRANPWSEGDGLDYAAARGASTTAGMDEFYGRVMPAPPARIREEDFVPLAQLYGREARVFTDDWREITPPTVAWHENDLAQLIGPRAWYVVAETNERIEAARAAGGTLRRREDGTLAVHVAAAVTHTIGGLQVDTRARVSGVEGTWAAGVDAGSVANGGYASGLAQALVLGLAAADSIAVD
jgi:NAD(P)-binding Rossmann-like domain